MTDIERTNKSLGSVCVKLDTNQKQILCENQQLNLENEALREKICDQKGNLTEFELDLLWKNKELKKLRLTKRKNETLQHENQSLKENITFIKKENFYKRLRRKQSKIERKERKRNKR
jgi:regulator of replication initiation timing